MSVGQLNKLVWFIFSIIGCVLAFNLHHHFRRWVFVLIELTGTTLSKSSGTAVVYHEPSASKSSSVPVNSIVQIVWCRKSVDMFRVISYYQHSDRDPRVPQCNMNQEFSMFLFLFYLLRSIWVQEIVCCRKPVDIFRVISYLLPTK